MFNTDLFLLLLVAFVTVFCGFRIFSTSVTRTEQRGFDAKAINEAWSPVRRWLSAIDVHYPSFFFLLGLAIVCVMTALLFMELFPGQIKPAFLASILIGAIAVCLLKDMADRRTAIVETELTMAASIMTSLASTNPNLVDVLHKSAVILKRRTASQIMTLASHLQRGMRAEEACEFLRKQYKSAGVDAFCDMVVTAASSDMPLAKGLVVGNGILAQNEKIKQSVRAHMSGVQYSSLFAGILPYALVPVLNWKEPGWLSTLSEHPQGATFLLSAIGCQAIGILWMRSLCSGRSK